MGRERVGVCEGRESVCARRVWECLCGERQCGSANVWGERVWECLCGVRVWDCLGGERVGEYLCGEREWGSVCAGRESVEVSVCEKRVWECLCKQRGRGRTGGGGSAFMCVRRRNIMREGEKRNGGKGGRVFADRGGYSYIPLQNMRLLKIYN